MAASSDNVPLLNEECARLPPKMSSFKIPNQGSTQVRVNGFRMDLKLAAPIVYQYKLTFIGERQRNGRLFINKLHIGPENDVSRETRRRLLWHLYRHLLQTAPEFVGHQKYGFVYDCEETMYSTRDFGLRQDEQKEFELDIDRNFLEQRCRCYIRNITTLKAQLSKTTTLHLRDTFNEVVQERNSVTNFLDLLSTQHMLDEVQYYIFGEHLMGSDAYQMDSVIRPQNHGPHVLKKGMKKCVIFAGNSADEAFPMLQIGPKIASFYPILNLVDYFCRLFGVRNGEELADEMGNRLAEANRHIKHLALETMFEPQCCFSAYGLTEKPASELEFEQDGEMMTVVEYFENVQKWRIRFPQLPCVIHKLPCAQSYYPMEFLKITPGQPLDDVDTPTPELVEELKPHCKVMPADMPIHIMDQFTTAITNNNQHFDAFEVRIESQPIVADAQLLFPPAIQFGDQNDRVELGPDNWSVIGQNAPEDRKYFLPAKFPKTYSIAIFDGCVAQEDSRFFTENFYIHTARRRGMIAGEFVNFSMDNLEDGNLHSLEEQFKFYAQNNCKFVFLFAPDDLDSTLGDIHFVNFIEEKYSILIQRVSPEVMQGCIDGDSLGLEQILMEINERMGGVNWNLVTSEASKLTAPNSTEIVENLLFGRKKMFFGITTAHAPPQSLFHRNLGTPPDPSAVSMAYTMGNAMPQMRATNWMLPAQQTTMCRESVPTMIQKIKLALMAYRNNNGFFPYHLIVFRGAIDDSEFKKVSAWEGHAFKKAFAELSTENSEFKAPAVTIVVCQRETNYRTFPLQIDHNLNPEQQNLPPGTVVDKGVMSPTLSEFLLTAQHSAEPVRCTVVHEYRPKTGPASTFPPIPLEELENITFILCFSTAKSTASTAEPGVLCKADEMAMMGQKNWKIRAPIGVPESEEQMNAASADAE